MKKIFALLLGLLCLSSLSFSQVINFDKSFSSNWTGALFDVDQTSDGGYVAIGTIGRPSATQGILNIYVRKYDQFGDTLWTKAIGGNSYLFPGSIEQTTDGGYIVCGQDIHSANEAYIAKLDSMGNIIWEKWLGNWGAMASFSSVKQHSNGTYTAVGGIRNNSNSTTYVYLVKFNAFGDTLFTRKYKQVTGLQYWGSELVLTSDNGYFIAATESPAPVGLHQAVLFKTDSLGNQQWVKTYPIERGLSGKQTTDGGYIIGGKSSPYSWQPNQAVLYKLNSTGDTVWTKRYPGHNIHSVIQTTDGGYAFTGSIVVDTIKFLSGQGIVQAITQDLLAVKTDMAGNMRYLRIYGDSIDDAGYSIKQTTDGGFIIAGAKDHDFAPGISLISWATNKGLLLKIDFTAQDLVLSIPKEMKKEVAFQLYPNPAAFKTIIGVPENILKSEQLQLKVTNILGEEVLLQKLDQRETTLQRGNLKPGIYLVQLINSETGRIRAAKKLILN